MGPSRWQPPLFQCSTERLFLGTLRPTRVREGWPKGLAGRSRGGQAHGEENRQRQARKEGQTGQEWLGQATASGEAGGRAEPLV